MNTHGPDDIVLRRAIDAVQALAEPVPPWSEILRSARDLVGSEGATFIVFEGRQLKTFESVGNDPASTQAYVDYYSAQDFMLTPDRPRPSGTWLDTEDALMKINRLRNEYYVDFMCGFRMRQIRSLVLGEGRRSAAISFQRARPGDDGDRWRNCPRIARYTQAVVDAMARRQAEADNWMFAVEGAGAAFGEGVLLVDLGGKVLRHCPWALALLDRSATGVQIRYGAVWHADPRICERIVQATARVHVDRGQSQLLVLSMPNGGVCRLDFARAPAALRLGNESMAIVRIRLSKTDFDLDPGLLGDLFDLTAAESRVLCALVLGETPAEHASRQGVTVHTVRRQIGMLMQKMNCNRQADLIRMALAVAGGSS